MDSKQSIVKTPIELELQKINMTNLFNYKNIEIEYHLLKVLHQIITNSPEIVNTSIFATIFNELLNYDQLEDIKMLPLFQRFSYCLWSNENFNIQLREKTNFYKIVSNWIINFELRSGKLQTIFSQFQLIKNFMAKETRTALEKLVMMQEIFQDLKDLISQEFWVEQTQLRQQNFTSGVFKKQLSARQSKNQKQQECSEAVKNTIEIIFQVLQSILNPLYYRFNPKSKLFKNCTYGNVSFSNVRLFMKKSIYYVLSQKSIPSHLQTQLSKIALIYLQSLPIEQSNDILNLLKHLMIKTSKAVRFALVIQYVQFYEYLELMGFDQVIEQLQNLIYFRQLIIGKKIVEQTIMDIGNIINDLSISYHQIYIKAGIVKRIYFSNEAQDCVLKLDVILEENDINMKINYFDNIPVETKQGGLKQYIFNSIHSINEADGSKMKAEKLYWKEDRSTSKKLELILQYKGLYCLQFDNTYSWVVPKNIKYRIELYEPLK